MSVSSQCQVTRKVNDHAWCENEMAMANDGADDGKLVVMYSIECVIK